MNPLPAFKMKTKVILAFLGLTTVVIALLAGLALDAFRSSLREEVLDANLFFARYLSSSLEGKMARAMRLAESVAATPDLGALPRDGVEAVLDNCLFMSGKMFSDLWYFGADGRVAAMSPRYPPGLGKGWRELPGMQRPVEEMQRTGKTIVVGRFAEARKGQKALILAPAGKTGGFLSGLVELGDWRTFSRAGAREEYATLVDEKGTIVSIDPDPHELKGSVYRVTVGQVAHFPHALDERVPGVKRVPGEPPLYTLIGSTPVTGEPELLTIAPVPLLGFRLLIGISERAALQNVERLRTRIWMLTALCWLAAALLGAAFAGRIVGPLLHLTRHVESMERGQDPPELTWRTNDEIGILGRAINAMAWTLRRERVMKDVFAPAPSPLETSGRITIPDLGAPPRNGTDGGSA